MVHHLDNITEDDLLTWEIQLRREGTLPPDVQARLIEAVRDELLAQRESPAETLEKE